uniref:Uncharacterized protein n=1 Tax=Catharus ustulatus TaxID=91951 RepID=A0A8C3Y8U1_CATUS
THLFAEHSSQAHLLKGQKMAVTSANMCRDVCRSDVQRAAQSSLLPVFALGRSRYLNIQPLGVILSFCFLKYCFFSFTPVYFSVVKQQCSKVRYILAIPVESVPSFINCDYCPGEMRLTCIYGHKNLVTVTKTRFKKCIKKKKSDRGFLFCSWL